MRGSEKWGWERVDEEEIMGMGKGVVGSDAEKDEEGTATGMVET